MIPLRRPLENQYFPPCHPSIRPSFDMFFCPLSEQDSIFVVFHMDFSVSAFQRVVVFFLVSVRKGVFDAFMASFGLYYAIFIFIFHTII